MNKNYIEKFSPEEKLILFSYLQSLKENSSFSQRLFICQSYSYIMLKSDEDNNDRLHSIIEDGVIEIEDPQTNLFVESVLSPYGSYRVFPGCFEYDRDNLSMLLFLAKKNNIPKESLSVVYFLLELSDLIAQRKGYGYWEKGCPEQKNVFIPTLDSRQMYNCDVLLSNSDIVNAAEKHSFNLDDLQNVMIDADLSVVKKEFYGMMYSETLEANPLHLTNNGQYVVLFLPVLLHCAYTRCHNILTTMLGKNTLYEDFENMLSNEVFYIIEKAYGCYIHGEVCDGVNYATFRLDDNKIASVVVCLTEMGSDVSEIQKTNNEKFKTTNPDCDIMPILIIGHLEFSNKTLEVLPDTIVFSLTELSIAMEQDDFKMIDLYSFWKSKKKIDTSFSEDIDVLAYYMSNKRSFYCNHQADMMYIDAGVALDMKSRYYMKYNTHTIFFDLIDQNVIVSHFDKIPVDVPIYTMTINNNVEFYLNKLNNSRYVGIHPSSNGIQDKTISLEITKSILLWMYAIEKRFNIEVLLKNIHIELMLLEQNNFNIGLSGEKLITYCIPLNIIDTEEIIHFEEMILTYLLGFLLVNKYINPIIGLQYVSCMFHECQGRFILLDNHFDYIAHDDGVNGCYYVNEGLCDIVLDDIAAFVGMKGYEKRLDVNESKQVVTDVIIYLRSEAEKLIKSIDTKRFLECLLELHHSMVFWTYTTKSRYEKLSKAYQYIGSSFDNQDLYLNRYAEINILTQGLVEFIVLNDIHVESSNFVVSDIELLFALMHEINNMGIYLDQIVAGVKNCELTILANGRLYVPDVIIQARNSYFYKLRNIELNYPDLYRKFRSLFPDYEINQEDSIFQTVYLANYGISYEKYLELIKCAVEYADKNDSPVTIIEGNSFRRLIATQLCEEEYQSFIKNFVLKSELKNIDLKESDCWLQRFNRKVQLTARPWVYYDNHYYYSTKTLFESLHNQKERIENGTIRSISKEMESYLGQIKVIKGKLFTCKIREYYESLKRNGLYVDSEVMIMPNGKLNSDKKYGDIDVLLIDRKSKKIVCIEAKNYVESRTVYELIEQNRTIVGRDLNKVIQRDNWCKTNILSFKAFDNLVDTDYTVRTVFLTQNECAYKYFEHDETRDITFLSALDIIENPMIVFD